MKTHLYFLEILFYYVIHQNDCLVFDTSNLNSSVKVNVSQTAIIKFKYRFESNDDRSTTPKIDCGYVDNGLRVLVTKVSNFTVTAGSNVPSNLRSRISTYTESGGDEVLGFSISRVQDTDPRNYRCRAYFSKHVGKIRETDDVDSGIVVLEVYRDPVACHDPLQSNYTFDENQSPSLSLTFCGVPKPTVGWTFNSRNINAGASSQQSSTVPYGFKYDVKLPRLTQNVCGKTLTYSASGYSGNNVLQGSSKIFIDFQPRAIENIIFFQESDSCNSVTWKALDVGDCSVIYTVEYMNSTGASILNVTGITFQRDCNPQSKNASSVRVWAVSGDRIGMIGVAVNLTTASVGNTESNDDGDNFGVIVFVVSGVLVVIIVTVFIVVLYKTILNNDKERCFDRSGETELKRPPKYHKEEYYAAISKKSVNQQNQQSGYAELNPETRRVLPSVNPVKSNYEIVLIGEEFMCFVIIGISFINVFHKNE